MITGTMITGDRYIVKDIINGVALVVQKDGMVIPSKWCVAHKRLESVAENDHDQGRPVYMYSLNKSVKAACAKHNLTPMTLDQVEAQVVHI